MDQGQAAPAKRQLTKQQKITLIIAGVVISVIVAAAAIQRGADDAIVKNGIEATATSTGSYLKTRDGGKRSKTIYKAQYSFKDESGATQFVHGERGYASVDEIIEGRAVTVKYLKDEPNKSIVVSGE